MNSDTLGILHTNSGGFAVYKFLSFLKWMYISPKLPRDFLLVKNAVKFCQIFEVAIPGDRKVKRKRE